MATATTTERDEALAKLREVIQPGVRVWTILRHVSRSGMTRDISVVILHDPGWGKGVQPWDISYLMARAGGFSLSRKHKGLRVGGCGMDMGFHLVYSLGRLVFPDGFDCTQYTHSGADLAEHDPSRRCPANDHVNAPYPKTQMRHRDGGYALNHSWL